LRGAGEKPGACDVHSASGEGIVPPCRYKAAMRAAAAPALRATLLIAVTCVLAGSVAAVGASAPRREVAKLPAALWGVELDARTAKTIGAKRLAAWRKAGINTLVTDPVKVRGRTLARLRSRAKNARLLQLAGPRSSKRTAVRRVRGVRLTVVRMAGPKAAASMRRRGRVLAILPLTSASVARKAAWRTAINAARARPALDLAVRPRGRKANAALNAFLALLTETTSTSPPPAPPPPPPPGPPPLPPASVFMSPSGSDSNPCSQAQPCRTFNRAYRVAAPGAVVEVVGGSYPGQTISPDPAKTSPNDVVFRPAPGQPVTVTGEIDANGSHFELRDMTVQQANFPSSADDVTFRNIVNHGMWMQGPINISIIGGEISCPTCNFHSHLQNGGGRAPTNILFDGVDFHDWHSQAGEHVECLQVLGGDGITIRNSVFRNCGTGNGGQGATADLHLQALGTPAPKNILLENNFFYPGGNLYPIQGEDFENFDLRYNSIGGPILIYDVPSSPGTGMDFIGNVLKASACTPQNNGHAINWRYNVIQGGTCGATDKNAAAGFVNAQSNMHLAPGSAALNAGDPTSHPSRDIDGQSRPAGAAPDAGADEAG
jgi:hypothetical protein